MRVMTASHQFEDHTSEVALTIEADTLIELFTEAAFALASLMLEKLAPPLADAPLITVEVSARDHAALLVDWLNELIYRADVTHAVATEVTIRELGPTHLVADLRGLPEPSIRGQAKAATLHRASVERVAIGWRAHVVLDV